MKNIICRKCGSYMSIITERSLYKYCKCGERFIPPREEKLKAQLAIAVKGLETVSDAQWNAESMLNAQRGATKALADIEKMKGD